jgi:hypothetical protein
MHTPHRSPTLFVSALVLITLACNLGGSPAPAEVVPTIAPTSAPPTAAPEAIATPTQVPSVPAAEPLVVAHQGSEFRIYTLDGSLAETRPAEGLSYARPNTAQVVGDAIYYVAGGGYEPSEVVRRVAADGSTDLDFTRTSEPGLAFAVSSDGAQIAWSHTSWASGPPFSQLWTAGIDGSHPTLVVQTDTEDGIEEFFVLEPVMWLDDGDLVYAWQVSGIGGYILFFGWSSLYRYDMATATSTPLAGLAPNVTAPCWTDVTSDGSYALGACGEGRAVVERNAASGVETVFPVLPDQGQAGAAVYSPAPGRLAYAIARGDPDNEAGQIVLIAAPGQAPTVLAAVSLGAFDRIEWVDETRLVASYWEGAGPAEGFVDRIELDGSRSPVGPGRLVGLMRR